MPVLALLGAGMLAYSCFYMLATALFDCDVLLGFLEKFGKAPRKYLLCYFLNNPVINNFLDR